MYVNLARAAGRSVAVETQRVKDEHAELVAERDVVVGDRHKPLVAGVRRILVERRRRERALYLLGRRQTSGRVVDRITQPLQRRPTQGQYP